MDSINFNNKGTITSYEIFDFKRVKSISKKGRGGFGSTIQMVHGFLLKFYTNTELDTHPSLETTVYLDTTDMIYNIDLEFISKEEGPKFNYQAESYMFEKKS